MDVEVKPLGNEIWRATDLLRRPLGIIVHTSQGFMIEPERGSRLAGIAPGPFASRKALSRHSSDRSSPSAAASRMALRTVVAQTPASAAMWPIVILQAPRFDTSAATTASTAPSPIVNRAASCGGISPEATHRLRRSIDSGERGRLPDDLRAT